MLVFGCLVVIFQTGHVNTGWLRPPISERAILEMNLFRYSININLIECMNHQSSDHLSRMERYKVVQ